MNNPIFDFIEEGMPHQWIIQNMGFEYHTILVIDWLDEDGESEKYESDPGSWLDNWHPKSDDDFIFVSKYDSEDGPCALFVRPTTNFAKALLDFGFTDEAKSASEYDSSQRWEEFQERAKAIRENKS